jgi:hypothetical protein
VPVPRHSNSSIFWRPRFSLSPQPVRTLLCPGTGPGDGGRTNIFLASSNLVDWVPISTNYATSNRVSITDYSAANRTSASYRVLQVP